MFLRVITGIGLFAFGYYIGKQVGRMEPINEELAHTRDQRSTDDGEAQDAPTPQEPGAQSA